MTLKCSMIFRPVAQGDRTRRNAYSGSRIKSGVILPSRSDALCTIPQKGIVHFEIDKTQIVGCTTFTPSRLGFHLGSLPRAAEVPPKLLGHLALFASMSGSIPRRAYPETLDTLCHFSAFSYNAALWRQ